MTSYGKLLRQLRERGGMTRAALAAAAGIDQAFMSRVEAGIKPALGGALSLKIERALGVDDGALFAQSAIERGEVSVEHLSKRCRALVAEWASAPDDYASLIAMGQNALCDADEDLLRQEGRDEVLAALGLEASEVEWAAKALKHARAPSVPADVIAQRRARVEKALDQREAEEAETSETMRRGAKAASLSAKILDLLTWPRTHGRTARQIADALVPAQPVGVVSNVLSGLRTRGKVKSTEGPNRKERIWSLVTAEPTA